PYFQAKRAKEAAEMKGEGVKYKTIHDAVRSGDVEQLEAMVKSGASINELDARDKFTPLHVAANVGAVECMHWLLWHGADATVTNPRGWTPVSVAAIRGQDACMQALITRGASVTTPDVRGSTPVHLSAAHGNSFTLQTLLRAGADVQQLDKQGWSPVHVAAYHGRLGCLQMLVRWGASLDEVDSAGNTPAHLAAMEGHLPVLKFIVTASGNSAMVLGARNDHGETPKMLAKQFYKQAVIEYIEHVEWERDYPEEQESLAFPAHLAAHHGDLAQLRSLVENGIVNVNERDDHGSTPAHKAAGQGHIDALQWLIEMGANVGIQNHAGETPKDVARRFAQLAAVKVLGGTQAEVDGEAYADGVDVDDVDDMSDPPYGNTEGDSLQLTPEQIQQAQGRAKKKIDELRRLLLVAEENYKQLGGKPSVEERREKREIRDRDRQIEELTSQLDYERLKRERLEGQLDEYRREIAQLQQQVQRYEAAFKQQELEAQREQEKRQRSGTKKSGSRKKPPTGGSSGGGGLAGRSRGDPGGVFIKRSSSQ
uniref:ANK_REP_REGION domain-containing protein n=1 Tax=Macrostomum lignano TaxID=282301 RepID=A0A1I8H5C3_9PLAT